MKIKLILIANDFNSYHFLIPLCEVNGKILQLISSYYRWHEMIAISPIFSNIPLVSHSALKSWIFLGSEVWLYSYLLEFYSKWKHSWYLSHLYVLVAESCSDVTNVFTFQIFCSQGISIRCANLILVRYPKYICDLREKLTKSENAKIIW